MPLRGTPATLWPRTRGATAAGFRAEFDGRPEFDFSGCEVDTVTRRAVPDGTVGIGP